MKPADHTIQIKSLEQTFKQGLLPKNPPLAECIEKYISDAKTKGNSKNLSIERDIRLETLHLCAEYIKQIVNNPFGNDYQRAIFYQLISADYLCTKQLINWQTLNYLYELAKYSLPKEKENIKHVFLKFKMNPCEMVCKITEDHFLSLIKSKASLPKKVRNVQYSLSK